MEISEEKVDELISVFADINANLLNISNFLTVAVAQFSHLRMADTQFIKDNDNLEVGYTEALGLHCKAYRINSHQVICSLSEVLEDDYDRIIALREANNEETE